MHHYHSSIFSSFPPFRSQSRPGALGLILNQRVVRGLVPGSVAADCRQISLGDELVEVDGRHVPSDSAIETLVGPSGSKVNLTFRRPASGSVYTVELIRSSSNNNHNNEQMQQQQQQMIQTLEGQLATLRLALTESTARTTDLELRLIEAQRKSQQLQQQVNHNNNNSFNNENNNNNNNNNAPNGATSMPTPRQTETEILQAVQLQQLNEEVNHLKSLLSSSPSPSSHLPGLTSLEEKEALNITLSHRLVEMEEILRLQENSLREKEEIMKQMEIEHRRRVRELEVRIDSHSFDNSVKSSKVEMMQAAQLMQLNEELEAAKVELTKKERLWFEREQQLINEFGEKEGNLRAQIAAADNRTEEKSRVISDLELRIENLKSEAAQQRAEHANQIEELKAQRQRDADEADRVLRRTEAQLKKEIDEVTSLHNQMEQISNQLASQLKMAENRASIAEEMLQTESEHFGAKLEGLRIEIERHASRGDDEADAVVGGARSGSVRNLNGFVRRSNSNNSNNNYNNEEEEEEREEGFDGSNGNGVRAQVTSRVNSMLTALQRLVQAKDALEDRCEQQALLIVAMHSEAKQYASMVSDAEERATTQATQLLSLNRECAELARKWNEMKNEREKREATEAKLFEAHEHLHSLEDENRSLHSAIDNLHRIQEEQNKLIGELEGRILRKKTRIQSARDNHQNAVETLELKREEVDIANERIEQLHSRVNTLMAIEAEMERMTEEFEKSRHADENNIKNLHDALETERKMHEEERETWRTRLYALEQRLQMTDAASDDKLKEMLSKMQTLSVQKGEAEGRAEEAMRHLSKQEVNLRHAHRTIADLERDLAMSRASMETQSAQIMQLNSTIKRQRDALVEAEQALYGGQSPRNSMLVI